MTAARHPSDLRRREIADAALAVIAEHGLARFTSLAIARKVGVTDGALFRHFASKGDIVLAAIERVEEILFAPGPPEAAEPLARLRAFFERRVAVIRENPGIARLVTSDQLAQAAPPEGVARVAALRRRSVEVVRRCLEDAAAAGALAPGVEPAAATVIVVGSLFALAHLRRELPGPTPAREELAADVWRELETLLRGRGGGRGRRPRALPGAAARTPSRRRRTERGGR
jgi:AcrR family transcriptional regulator